MWVHQLFMTLNPKRKVVGLHESVYLIFVTHQLIYEKSIKENVSIVVLCVGECEVAVRVATHGMAIS